MYVCMYVCMYTLADIPSIVWIKNQ